MKPPKNPYSQNKRKSESLGDKEKEEEDVDPNFDHARPSKRARCSAFVHFDDCQKEKNEDLFEEMKDLDPETQGELVISRLISFCEWFSSKAILQKNNKNKALGVVSKKQYSTCYRK